MTAEELVEGRNLIDHGGFTPDWRKTWTVDGTHLVRLDSITGKYYLQLSDGATARCSVDLPVSPREEARYWFSFSYEGQGARRSNVTVKTGGGEVIFDEDFTTREPQEKNSETAAPAPFAELRPYPPKELEPLSSTDTKLEMVVTAAVGGDRDGINITDVKFDLRLDRLALKEFTLDGRPITRAVSSSRAVS